MVSLRKHTSKGKRSRQERALKQRMAELERYNTGDYLDHDGLSMVKSVSRQSTQTRKKNKKQRARDEIAILKDKLNA
ncbi:MAG: hypothetical protein ACRD4B_01755 [Acidobacteriota bacterium]